MHPRYIRVGVLGVCALPLAAILAVPIPAVAEPPGALALLRGVEAVRRLAAPLKATFAMEYISPPPARTVRCSVECDGNKRRFETAATSAEPKVVAILDGEKFYSFRSARHEDVCVFDVRDAVGVRAERCFDPRILGLSSLMLADHTVKGCLLYESAADFRVIGKDELHGRSVWRVSASVNSTRYDYWIEEPSFRLYRRTIEHGRSREDIRSEYDAQSPLPARVHIKRTSPRGVMEVSISVTAVEWPESIRPERFTLQSMELPTNTMINDYRSRRIAGYWNGEGISKDPVYLAELPSPHARQAPAGAGRRWLAITSGALLLILILLFVARRYRRAQL